MVIRSNKGLFGDLTDKNVLDDSIISGNPLPNNSTPGSDDPNINLTDKESGDEGCPEGYIYNETGECIAYDGPMGNPREQKTIGENGHFYNEDGVRVYYFAPPFETGEESYEGDDGTLVTGSATAGIGQNPGGYYTEAEIKAYWDNNMSTFREQHADMDWDTYWEYINERQGYIESGELADPTNFMNAAINANRNPCLGLTGRDEEICRARNDVAIQEGSLASMEEWLASEINQQLNEKYGITASYTNADGDKYLWNGSSYVRTYEAPGVDWGAIVAGVMVGAFTGSAVGPGIAGALGGGAGAGAAGGAISSMLGQAILTGEIDPSKVVQAALLGGVGGFFDDLVAADPGTYGGWIVNGEVVGTAGTWAIEKGQMLADLLGISQDSALSIIEGILTGVIKGEDLEGVVLNALGSWGTEKIQSYITDLLGDSGIDVDNLFREGETNISTDAINGIVGAGIQALIDGGMSTTDAVKVLYDYFNDGGSLDFLWPALEGLNWESLIAVGGALGDPCSENSPISFLCNLDLPDGCPEWLQNEDGECPSVDISLPECAEGLEWDEALKVCVPIPNPCGEGLVWDADLKECIPDVCPEGFVDNGDGKGCVKIPDIQCPEGWDVDEDGVCIEPPTVCDEGYSWDPALEKCVPDIPEVKCPEGWDVDEDGVCIEPPIVCGEGYEWDQDLGECVTIEVDITCPEGFQRDDLSGECVKIEIQCPEGWDIDEDGVCIEPPTVCDEGYSWDPDIRKCLPDQEPCPEGTERNIFGQCVEPDCPSGYERDENGECVKTETPTETPEPEGGVSVGGGGGAGGSFSGVVRGISYTPQPIPEILPPSQFGQFGMLTQEPVQQPSRNTDILGSSIVAGLLGKYMV